MKIIVIGDIAAGKTSLIRRHVEGNFTHNYKATVGVDFFCKGEVQFWDIAGQERFGAMTRAFYQGAHAAMVVMDWSAEPSLRNAFRWVKDLRDKLPYPVPMVLVCNKCDLPSIYSLEDIDAQCKPLDMPWFSVSAKTGAGVAEAFCCIVRRGEEAAREGEREVRDGSVILVGEKKQHSCC